MTLELDGIERTYPDFTVGPITLSIDQEVVSVLGPSGSGKTTVLSVVAGLTAPTSGRVGIDDRDVTDTPPEHRGIAMVFQDGALFPHLTARQNIAYAATNPDRVDDLAATLDIVDVLDRSPKSLSGGERQRVALARAVAADPAALLLDEPLANLDAPIRERLRPTIRRVLAGLDIPVVHVTHDQRTAATFGDRIAVMHDGRLEHVGTPTSVFHRPATPFVAEFTGHTVITTTVTRRGGDAVLEWGGAVLGSAPTAEPGAVVQVAVRAHAVSIDPSSGAAGERTVTGRVADHVFEGDRHRLTVAVTHTDQELTVELAPDPSSIPVVGDSVDVTIPESAVTVLEPPTNPPPEDGRSR